MPDKTYGIGIIGAGQIFTDHADAIEKLGQGMRLVGVADTSAVQLSHAADRFGPAITTSDYRELLDREDIDVIAVCTPPATHERMVIDALEAGKFVICEKPLAHSVASADRIREAAARYPGRLSVVYQLRYIPDIQKTVWLRDNGRLGQLTAGHFIRFDRLSPFATKWWGQWQTAGGGVAMTQFIHQLDLACHLFGQPVAVQAQMDTYAADIESEDTFAATIRFESGAIASCTATLTSQAPPLQQWHIFGSRGTIQNPWACHGDNPAQMQRDLQQLDLLYPPLSGPVKQPSMHIAARAFRKGLRILKLGGHVTPPRATPLHLPYYRAVLQAIRKRLPLPISADDAVVSLELCTAIYIASLTGESVQLPLDRANPYCEGLTRDDYQNYRTHAQRSAEGHAHAGSGSAS
ncbi:MAG: Gfo/Idh/MocA family oxidoreductase [Phycisphaeraceae bacterium]